MRQGEPSRIVAQEYDLCEAEFGTYIGGLQLLVSNEGRKVAPKQAPSPPGGHKHKKKVTSKPLEKVETAALPNLATMYEAAKTHQSEDARKKLRVERLKRQTVQTELQANQTLTVLSNPTASEWDKMSSLRQIEMVRETKKHAILEKVLKESLGSKQTVDVVTGQPALFHFLVSNPLPQEEVFSILVSGDEAVPELKLVHNESDQEW
jgi:hypothetical protein